MQGKYVFLVAKLHSLVSCLSDSIKSIPSVNYAQLTVFGLSNVHKYSFVYNILAITRMTASIKAKLIQKTKRTLIYLIA